MLYAARIVPIPPKKQAAVSFLVSDSSVFAGFRLSNSFILNLVVLLILTQFYDWSMNISDSLYPFALLIRAVLKQPRENLEKKIHIIKKIIMGLGKGSVRNLSAINIDNFLLIEIKLYYEKLSFLI